MLCVRRVYIRRLSNEEVLLVIDDIRIQSLLFMDAMVKKGSVVVYVVQQL